ncbi:DNA primase [Corallococcus carmarthensis]|uniref:DNA primase n=1 Tax=Corallococcus carmarthensis TaxID=2316728 RepID=A0A3A8JMS0_9BACT|nr:DNA primase [Corallococcus carmarthensis]RKG97072.1 DNA primase [Corallococcus carmarthensis]
MIPEHKIQEVLDRVDIVSLVSRHVELKKAGREFKGRCPFHQEKTPSFYVVPEKRFYFCHGCRASGDAVSFVQRYLGKTFQDAVQDLAQEVGIDLEAAQDPGLKERQQVKEATDFAAEHFRTLLWHEDEGRAARAYLASRGVSEEVAKGFGLGWAPAEWGLLADRFQQNGMLEWGLKAGLITKRASGDGYNDFFRSRLMVPIRAPEGRPIAFGGRLVAAEDGPKYLNSRESRLYNKSETLFGMDQARDAIRKRKTAILVEGYFDCIGLHQVGVHQAVALCSTNLTTGHLQLLKRADTRDVMLLLDGDSAGLAAVERLAGPLLATGTPTRVAILPQGDDPDEFARREGLKGMERLLEGAQTLTAYLFATLLPKGTRAEFEEKMVALERLRPVTIQVPPGLTRSALVNALASHFGWTPEKIESALQYRPPPPPKPVPLNSASAQQSPSTAPRPQIERPPHESEALYVAAILREPRLLARDIFRVCDELSHMGLRVLLAQATSGKGAEEALYEATEVVKRALVAAGSRLSPAGMELESEFLLTCRDIMLRRIDERLVYIKRATEQTPGSFDLTEETRQLLSERKELLALRKRVLDELRPASSATGTKAPMQPV